MKWTRMVTAGAVLLFLSGCGGGGGGSPIAVGGTETTGGNVLDQSGGNVLDQSGGSVLDQYRGEAAGGGSNYQLPPVNVTHDLLFLLGSPSVPTPSGNQHTIEPFVLPCRQGSMCWTTIEAERVERVMERAGVLVFRLSGQNNALGIRYDTYGGWLDSTVFSMVRSCSLAGECAESGGFDAVALGVAGTPTGSIPTGPGSASWTGVVVGSDIGTRNLILGDARITIDELASPEVDVFLTGMWDVAAGTRRADISWVQVPVRSNGVFVQGHSPLAPGFSDMTGEYIIGQFHGENGREVGGTFESTRHAMRGAFGGNRQR